MAFKFPYQQQYDYMKKLVTSLKKKGIPKEVVTALAVNAYHESYLNPYTIEGAINPGPPLGANGVDTGRDGLGLWQWTQQGNPIMPHLGDFDWQVNYMLTYKEQWTPYATWFQNAGVPDPTPKIESYDDFLYNKKGYNDADLTKAFIGYWERPDYTAGVGRMQSANTEAPQFRELVDQYWGSGGSSGGSSNNGGGVPNKNGSDKPNKVIGSDIKNVIEQVYKLMSTSLSYDVKKMANCDMYTNNHVTIIKKYNDTAKVKLKLSLNDVIQSITDLQQPFNPYQGSNNDKPKEPTSKPSNNATNDQIYKGIIEWCQNNMGKAYNYPEAHPEAPWAQCVDLIKAISIYYLNGDPLRGVLSKDHAQGIYPHDLTGTGWKHAQGDIIDDDNAVRLYNQLPNGAIVFWTYADFGHVGIKCGDNMEIYNQNWAGQHYISRDNVLSWQRYNGAGYLGAWVLE